MTGQAWQVTRSTSGGPRGSRTRTVDAPDALAAVKRVAASYGDSGQGRIQRQRAACTSRAIVP